ncbi:restriction endonuclease subunit S [Cupriavidus taiwanensis]|uniref:restriction endonuclease subunit S n=1 Tax=Cupriavidus taiwanensis TaxID=164546 RepID=UPI000E18D0D8|nr:restriction endonuclease subunit S [Cupriavidus taiwanensis]SPA26900.1 Type I restriction-modification system, S subunit [Cupriavidus taiwanensis]
MSLHTYSQYKDSGVEWLGDVPAHWTVAPLKRGYEVCLGKMLQNEALGEGDALRMYLRAANIQWGGVDIEDVKSMWLSPLDRKQLRLKFGDLLVSEGGDVGRSAVWRDDLDECYIQNSVNRVRSIGRNSTNFLYYWMATIKSKGYVDVLCNKSTIAHFTAEKVAAVPVPFPPYDEQTAIAAFLDRETGKIDVLISEQKKLLALLAEKRQASISHAVTRGLNPDVPMKDSGVAWLGEMPMHWEIVRLGQLFREVTESGDDTLPILSVSIHDGVSDKELSDDELDRKVTRSDDRSKYKKVVRGDLVYNMMRAWQGGFGTVETTGMVSPAYVVARPIDDGFLTGFVEQLLRTPQGVQEMKRYSRGITDFRLRLYWGEFKGIKIPLPPLLEQEKIMAAFEETAKYIDHLSEQATSAIELLKERRSALIAAAVTGKIDIRDAVPQELAA